MSVSLQATRKGKQKTSTPPAHGYGLRAVTNKNNTTITSLDLVRGSEVVRPFHNIPRSDVVGLDELGASDYTSSFELFSQHGNDVTLLMAGYVLVVLGQITVTTDNSSSSNSSSSSIGQPTQLGRRTAVGGNTAAAGLTTTRSGRPLTVPLSRPASQPTTTDIIVDAYLIDNTTDDDRGYSYFFNNKTNLLVGKAAGRGTTAVSSSGGNVTTGNRPTINRPNQHRYTTHVYQLMEEYSPYSSKVRQWLEEQPITAGASANAGDFDCIISLLDSYKDLLNSYEGPVLDVIQEIQYKFQYIMKIGNLTLPIITVIPADNYVRLNYYHENQDNGMAAAALTDETVVTELVSEAEFGLNLEVDNADVVTELIEDMLNTATVPLDPEAVISSLASLLTNQLQQLVEANQLSSESLVDDSQLQRLTIRQLYLLQQALDNLAVNYLTEANLRVIDWLLLQSSRTQQPAYHSDPQHEQQLTSLISAADIELVNYPSFAVNDYIMIGIYTGLF